MKKNNSFFVKQLTLLLSSFFILSCSAYSQETAPYVINGNFVMEDGALDYSICGVDFYLLNKSSKEIKKINVVFYLFDKDGEPAYECRSKISGEIEKTIEAGGESNFCMSLDNFMNLVPADPLVVDYLYLAKIEYEDGSLWEDPFGLFAFK